MHDSRLRSGKLALALLVMAPFLMLGNLLVAARADSSAEEAAWRALAAGGHVALMRHALAPGIGDPPGFALGDCTTQRNLSRQGRDQARAIGERFRERGVEVAALHSSRWCRCLETAEGLRLCEVIPNPALDSFFRERGQAEARTRAARELIRDWDGEGTLVLVTHQVNITALLGGGVASGEIIVVRPEAAGLEVVGRLRLAAAPPRRCITSDPLGRPSIVRRAPQRTLGSSSPLA